MTRFDMNDAVTKKKHRMEQALGMIKAMGETEYTKAVAIISFNIGLSETKAREYIRTFKELGQIKVKNGIISTYSEDLKKDEEVIDKIIKG